MEVVNALLDAGADINAKRESEREKQNRPYPFGETEWHKAGATAKLLKEAAGV